MRCCRTISSRSSLVDPRETIVPLRIYFNAKGRAKIVIALGRGKKLHDKRESEKARDWNRDKSRLMRERG